MRKKVFCYGVVLACAVFPVRSHCRWLKHSLITGAAGVVASAVTYYKKRQSWSILGWGACACVASAVTSLCGEELLVSGIARWYRGETPRQKQDLQHYYRKVILQQIDALLRCPLISQERAQDAINEVKQTKLYKNVLHHLEQVYDKKKKQQAKKKKGINAEATMIGEIAQEQAQEHECSQHTIKFIGCVLWDIARDKWLKSGAIQAPNAFDKSRENAFHKQLKNIKESAEKAKEQKGEKALLEFINNEVSFIRHHARLNKKQRDEAEKKIALQEGVVKSLIHQGIQFGHDYADGPNRIKEHAQQYVHDTLWRHCKPSEIKQEFDKHYAALAESDARRVAFWDSLMSVIGFRDST